MFGSAVAHRSQLSRVESHALVRGALAAAAPLCERAGEAGCTRRAVSKARVAARALVAGDRRAAGHRLLTAGGQQPAAARGRAAAPGRRAQV